MPSFDDIESMWILSMDCPEKQAIFSKLPTLSDIKSLPARLPAIDGLKTFADEHLPTMENVKDFTAEHKGAILVGGTAVAAAVAAPAVIPAAVGAVGLGAGGISAATGLMSFGGASAASTISDGISGLADKLTTKMMGTDSNEDNSEKEKTDIEVTVGEKENEETIMEKLVQKLKSIESTVSNSVSELLPKKSKL